MQENEMQKLTVDLLKTEAKVFSEKESSHKEKSLYGNAGGHPLKGTCQEKKVVRKQENALLSTSVFLGRTVRLREWAAMWLVGAAATL